MEPLKTKSVTVTYSNGAVRHFRVSVYKSEAYTYGNQFSLTLENEDNGYMDSYDIRYDTRIRRDLGNFDSYVEKFIVGELSGVVSVS